jgi:hypothetical protein
MLAVVPPSGGGDRLNPPDEHFKVDPDITDRESWLMHFEFLIQISIFRSPGFSRSRLSW